jgi:selenocysteine lyase/cysteine desulfurase
VVGLADLLRNHLTGLGLSPQEIDLPSPIVSFHAEDPDALLASLADAGVRATSKLGRVRVGFHVYNDENDVDLVCDVLGR